MDLSKIKEFIIQQNLINKIHNNPKEIYPLGSFNSYSNVPLGWNKKLDINDFKDKYTKINKFKKFIFIGLGGSINLAKIAGFINPENIYTIDNFNLDKIKVIKEIINSYKCAIFICSKSGTTLETKILRDILTDENKHDLFYISDNYELDQDKRRTLITQKDIGGRFSLATHFGILPFVLAGFSLEKIIQNINDANEKLKINNSDNLAIKIASIMYKNYLSDKKIISINSIHKNDYIAEWFEQLLSESLGKEESGLLPILNNNNFSPNIIFSDNSDSFEINSINIQIKYDESIFYKFQIFFYVIALLGALLNIQPFDQPNVELTKRYTRKYLESNNPIEINFKDYSSFKIFENKIKLHNQDNQILSILLFSTIVSKKLSHKLEELRKFCFNIGVVLLIYFAPTYLHSTGQLLKGSFSNIQNFIIFLHGNEDQNIQNSLYTLNTFVKNQAISDFMAMKECKRKIHFIKTMENEFIEKITNIIE